MVSKKTEIIEYLFYERWSQESESLMATVINLRDVSDAIRHYNANNLSSPLSDANPANFFKDFVRKKKSANANFPRSVFERGYTARQTTGDGQCFEFVPIQPGQTEPFPLDGIIPIHTEDTPVHQIGSIKIPSISRQFGVSHETWLVQVLVTLGIVETHFALFSSRYIHEIGHLQTGVKLRRAELDALFFAVEHQRGIGDREIMICCEAKGRSDDILEDQILAQVEAVFSHSTPDAVIPTAAKIVAPSKIYLVEFEAIDAGTRLIPDVLAVANTVIYELVPPVKGIS